MRTQIWSPDTCGCQVEETLDENHECISSRTVRKCSIHDVVNDDELYGVLYANPDGENKRKNLVHGILLGCGRTKGLGLEEEKTNKDGSKGGIGLKQGLKYNWHFTGSGKDRMLHFEVEGTNISQADRKRIKDECEEKFGKDKVNHI